MKRLLFTNAVNKPIMLCESIFIAQLFIFFVATLDIELKGKKKLARILIIGSVSAHKFVSKLTKMLTIYTYIYLIPCFGITIYHRISITKYKEVENKENMELVSAKKNCHYNRIRRAILCDVTVSFRSRTNTDRLALRMEGTAECCGTEYHRLRLIKGTDMHVYLD